MKLGLNCTFFESVNFFGQNFVSGKTAVDSWKIPMPPNFFVQKSSTHYEKKLSSRILGTQRCRWE